MRFKPAITFNRHASDLVRARQLGEQVETDRTCEAFRAIHLRVLSPGWHPIAVGSFLSQSSPAEAFGAFGRRFSAVIYDFSDQGH